MPRHSQSDSKYKAMDDPNAIAILERAIRSQDAVFCCGGVVPTSDAKANACAVVSADNEPFTSHPVVIRWDPSTGAGIGRLTLPFIDGLPEDSVALGELLKYCAPASFAVGGRELLDESYRKAAKLDSDQFSTNFNPNNCGIVDAISQTLLPEVARIGEHIDRRLTDHLGVVAELYKLNIYSGPSGRFKPHVDTPRSANQFGSLVVCLPYPHKGGQLRVNHGGTEHVWDWSNDKATAIGWAAFYSDCEHEVLEVQSGHRLTLTYNLYIRERQGALLRRHPVAAPQSYSLFETVRGLLGQPGFLHGGGTLGFHCAHTYAHSNDRAKARLPYALKGLDVIIYTVFRSLGLRVSIRPLLERTKDSDEEDYCDSDASNGVGSDSDVSNGVGSDWIGTELHAVQFAEEGGDGDDPASDIVWRNWPCEKRTDIQWLNERGPEELAVVHLAYGNEPSLQWHYSSAALLVRVPSFVNRSRVPAGKPTEATKQTGQSSGTARGLPLIING